MFSAAVQFIYSEMMVVNCFSQLTLTASRGGANCKYDDDTISVRDVSSRVSLMAAGGGR